MTKKNDKKSFVKYFVESLKLPFANLNWPVMLIMIFLSIFGCVMVLSASNITAVLRYHLPANYYFIRQIIFVVFGYIIGLLILVSYRNFKDAYKIIFRLSAIIAIALVGGVLIYGTVSNGAKSWYDLGKVSFQPSEIAKLLLILYLSWYYKKLSKKNKVEAFDLILPAFVSFIIAILIFLEPDLGGAVILIMIFTFIFLSVPIAKGLRNRLSLCLFGLILLAGLVFVFGGFLKSYQNSRFNFSKPCSRYTEESGYQVCNSYIAFHNGGLFGVGLGNSTQKYMYLPEAHTDFIFPIVCEELGGAVGILIVLLYALLLYFIGRESKRCSNIQGSVICVGVFSYILVHVLVNLMGVLGLIPLTGVPLPFLSYGGSYNVTLIIALFFFQCVCVQNSVERKRAKIANL
jgi:cell division protein FtsW